MHFLNTPIVFQGKMPSILLQFSKGMKARLPKLLVWILFFHKFSFSSGFNRGTSTKSEISNLPPFYTAFYEPVVSYLSIRKRFEIFLNSAIIELWTNFILFFRVLGFTCFVLWPSLLKYWPLSCSLFSWRTRHLFCGFFSLLST